MDKSTHTANDRLSKIFGAVVPSDEKFNFKVVDYKNPENPCRLAKFLASRTFPASYQIYLVNESGHDLASVELSTGGSEGTGDQLVELNRLTNNLGPLKRGESILIVLNLTFSDGLKIEGTFSIEKSYSLHPSRYCFSEALGRKAFLFKLSETSACARPRTANSSPPRQHQQRDRNGVRDPRVRPG
jgi:hypothetical protein